MNTRALEHEAPSRSHPRHPSGRGCRAAPGGEEPPPAPSAGAKSGGSKGGREGVVKRLLARSKADAD